MPRRVCTAACVATDPVSMRASYGLCTILCARRPAFVKRKSFSVGAQVYDVYNTSYVFDTYINVYMGVQVEKNAKKGRKGASRRRN